MPYSLPKKGVYTLLSLRETIWHTGMKYILFNLSPTPKIYVFLVCCYISTQLNSFSISMLFHMDSYFSIQQSNEFWDLEKVLQFSNLIYIFWMCFMIIFLL